MNYSKLSLLELKKLARERKLIVPQNLKTNTGYVSKKAYVTLLSKTTILHIPPKYEPSQTRSILIFGCKSLWAGMLYEDINGDSTGCKDCTVSWADLVINRTVKTKYSKFIIFNPDLFFTIGKEFRKSVLERLINDNLYKNGTIDVFFSGSSGPILKFLEEKYVKNPDSWYRQPSSEPKGKPFTPKYFRSFHLVDCPPGGKPEDGSPSSSAPFLNTGLKYDDLKDMKSDEKEIPPVVKVFEKINLEFTLFPQSDNSLDMDAVVNTSICLEDFTSFIRKKSFLKAYKSSLEKLYKHKLIFYRDRHAAMSVEYDETTKRIEKLKLKGANNDTIKELFPRYMFYACFMIEVEEIIKKLIESYNSLDIKIISKNLKDAVTNPVRGLKSIVGREKLKDELIQQIYAFSRNYKTATKSFNNICLMGCAGVGKTKIAGVIAFVLAKSGILSKGTIKIVSRSDLVGQYVGHTAPRTRGILMGSLEGVLFIDEAYQLYVEGSKNDFGAEAITEMVNFLDKYIGMSTIILAGYEGKLRNLLTSNEGMNRRFPQQYTLPNYSCDDLCNILIHTIKQKVAVDVSSEVENWLYSMICYISDNYAPLNVFCNQAGDMLNLGGCIAKSINGAFRVKWGSQLSSNKDILVNGIREFLKMKDVSILM